MIVDLTMRNESHKKFSNVDEFYKDDDFYYVRQGQRILKYSTKAVAHVFKTDDKGKII